MKFVWISEEPLNCARFQLKLQVFVIFKTRVCETASKHSSNRTFLPKWVQYERKHVEFDTFLIPFWRKKWAQSTIRGTRKIRVCSHFLMLFLMRYLVHYINDQSGKSHLSGIHVTWTFSYVLPIKRYSSEWIRCGDGGIVRTSMPKVCMCLLRHWAWVYVCHTCRLLSTSL